MTLELKACVAQFQPVPRNFSREESVLRLSSPRWPRHD